MERKPVESTNIRAVGFADGVIEVEFRDGAIYQQSCDEATYERFLSSPSKGRFVRVELTMLQRLAGDVTPGVTNRYTKCDNATPDVAPEIRLALGDLDSPIVEMFEHDDCCTKAFQRASVKGELSTNVWTCPKCGCLWIGHTDTEASIRTWRPQEMIEILRTG